MNLPTRISIHPLGRIILHYPDRELQLSDLPPDERRTVLAEIAERYNLEIPLDKT